MLLLAAVLILAVLRARYDQQRHHSLEHAALASTAAQRAAARFFEGNALLAAMVWAQEPSLGQLYRKAASEAKQALSLARASALAAGRVELAAEAGDLIERLNHYYEEVNPVIDAVIQADTESAQQMAIAAMSALAPEAMAIGPELEGLAVEGSAVFAAESTAADRASEMTLTLLIAFGAVAFLGGAVALMTLVVSVVRPLASLQTSVRAVASGDLAARVRVSGPEETASLARDFNEMVGARRRAEEALRESEQRLRNVFETVTDGIVLIAQDGQIVQANAAAERILGLQRSEIESRNYVSPDWEILRPDGTPMPPEEMAGPRAMTEKRPIKDVVMGVKRPDGALAWINVSAAPLIDEAGELAGVVGTFADITDRRRAEETLREQARRDPLTGVLNHAAIVEQLRDLISNEDGGSLHAVAMVDVDGLKATNDMYGHQAGDAVLAAVAHALPRDGATVGRYGGDEFVAVLPGADRGTAERYRDAVLGTLAEAGVTDPETGASVPVSASIGLAIYPDEAEAVEDLIRLSDSEMYAAKRQRPVRQSDPSAASSLTRTLAAEMTAELAPLLTSQSDLNDKLRLVAHRLSLGAGYDAVNFRVFGCESEPPTTQAAFAGAPDEAIEVWNREHRQIAQHPLRPTLERTRRPIILDDLQDDERLTDGERELLRGAGLRSAMVAPMLWQNEVIGSLSVASRREAAFTPGDAQFLMAVATQVTAVVRMATLVDELQSASDRLAEARTETVMMLAASAEAHDHTTGLHLQNVRAITEALARELGYSDEDASELSLAAVLHDIGKIRVPDAVLGSTGKLLDEEWELMKHHTTWGEEFLRKRPGFELAATIARSHHEHWDGSGYPDGLSGEAIPEAATIVAVADAFDAMISDRPYRPARPVAAALREIAACSGTQFSPKVAKAMARLRKRNMLPLTLAEAPDREVAA